MLKALASSPRPSQQAAAALGVADSPRRSRRLSTIPLGDGAREQEGDPAAANESEALKESRRVRRSSVDLSLLSSLDRSSLSPRLVDGYGSPRRGSLDSPRQVADRTLDSPRRASLDSPRHGRSQQQQPQETLDYARGHLPQIKSPNNLAELVAEAVAAEAASGIPPSTPTSNYPSLLPPLIKKGH